MAPRNMTLKKPIVLKKTVKIAKMMISVSLRMTLN
jgi:hypothetical protein